MAHQTFCILKLISLVLLCFISTQTPAKAAYFENGHTKSTESPGEDGQISSQHSLLMFNFKRKNIMAEQSSERLAKRADIDLLTPSGKFYIDPNLPEHQQLLQKMAAAERAGRPFILSTGQSQRKTPLDLDQPSEPTDSRLVKHTLHPSIPLESTTNYQRFLGTAAEELKDRLHLVEGADERTVKSLQLQLRSSLEALLNQLDHLKWVTESKMKKMGSSTSSQENGSGHFERGQVDTAATSSRLFNGKDYDTDLRQYIVHYLPKHSAAAAAKKK